MKIFILLIIILSIVGFFSNCSQFPTSGGATLPNFISGVVVDSSNIPISAIDVNITAFVFNENGQEVVLARETVKTDAEGKFIFENIERRQYLVEASTNGLQTIQSHIFPTSSDSTHDRLFVLNNLVNIKGRVIAENPVSVSVAGTSQHTQTDQDGFYTLENIPTGNLFLIFRESDRTSIMPVSVAPSYDTVFVRDADINQATENEFLAEYFEVRESFSGILSTVDYSTLTLPSWYEGRDFSKVLTLAVDNEKLIPSSSPESERAFLIDNFDHETSRFFLPIFHQITGGYWYIFSDSDDTNIVDGTSTIEKSLVVDNTALKNSLRVEGILRENSAANSYLGFTVVIGNNEQYTVDLSLMESISFDIKGNGEMITVQFFTLNDSGVETVFYSSFTVEENWRRVVITADSFAASDSQMVWGITETPVSKIQFIFRETYSQFDTTAVVYIDNIYLNGITRETFLNYRRIN